jgi:hypothetical protein
MKYTLIDYMQYKGKGPMGWYIWSYPSDHHELFKWLKDNMTAHYEAIPRYNSGYPMVETFITDEADYTMFKLTWTRYGS